MPFVVAALAQLATTANREIFNLCREIYYLCVQQLCCLHIMISTYRRLMISLRYTLVFDYSAVFDIRKYLEPLCISA